MIDTSLYSPGGVVKVRISSNNRDYSTQNFVYSYLPMVTVTGLSPLWVVNGVGTLVTIAGSNFFASPLLAVKLQSSDE